jgi:pyruvate dehydrogenase E2 component (dihydrolipoamide acetyltransferase)
MSVSNSEKSSKILPFKGIRKTIAERLVKSHMTTPHVTLMREVDVTELKRFRESLLRKSNDVHISYSAILVKICANVLKMYLLMNSRLEGDKIRLLEEVNS